MLPASGRFSFLWSAPAARSLAGFGSGVRNAAERCYRVEFRYWRSETAVWTPASARLVGNSCLGLLLLKLCESKAVAPLQISFCLLVSSVYFQEFSVPKENI